VPGKKPGQLGCPASARQVSSLPIGKKDMIRFERTRDFELVALILTHPKLYPWIADDFFPAPENYWPNESESIWRLLVFDDDDCLGLITTHPINPLLWEVDHALLPKCWGSRAREVGRAFEAWLWENTPAEKAVGFTPSCNRLALAYAKRAGMTEAGRVSGCYRRHFETHDLVIFEKARPAAKDN
jgi:RimJ/RimL family protein N-acetyltransferase